MFAFQMQHSIKQFIVKPEVEISSTTNIDKISMPIIYVCEGAQFDYATSNFYGYEWIENFVSGQLSDSSKITWKGKYDNITFKDLSEKLFIYNHSSFIAETYNPEDSETYKWKRLNATKVRINPYGFCMKLNQSKGSTYFSTTQKSLFQIVDPQADNLVVISSMENGIGEFGPTENGFFDYYSYTMDISLLDKSLVVGKLCANYDDHGYTNCLIDAMIKQYLEWYGCLPPFFTTNYSPLCDENKVILMSDKSRKEMIEEFNRLSIGQAPKSFESCLPPCLTMKIKLKQLKHITNNPKAAGVRIDMNKKTVKVYTLAYAYDAFNLVVDLGSAFVLWFGLSAISTYDTVIKVLVLTSKRHYYYFF